MPVGPTINVLATLIGSLIGASLGHYVPEKIKDNLPQAFGLIAFSLGIPLVVGMTHMLSAVLAILLGLIIGELLNLEKKLTSLTNKLKRSLEKRLTVKSDNLNKEEFMTQFMAVFVLFSASGLGVIGAMGEGMTGDASILILKATLDFFTAIIFGAKLGHLVSLTAISQGIVMFTLYLLGAQIMPLTTPEMLNNFSAVGGMIMLATGFQIMGIKEFSITNFLPALFIVMPLFYLLA